MSDDGHICCGCHQLQDFNAGKNYAVEECIAIMTEAWEKSWVVQDAIDAMRKLNVGASRDAAQAEVCPKEQPVGERKVGAQKEPQR